ncbi:hypothetical protein Lal_00035409 [Lupinus albus]|nr:hypothetical protein Lal_00035409 [Lupinus albus]
MKKFIRARSKNVKLHVEWNMKDQPLNNKGGNTLVRYIGVLVRRNVSITFSSWIDVRMNSVKGRIWEDIISRQLFMLVMSTSITSSNFSARLSDNSEPMSEKVSKMLMVTLKEKTSLLQIHIIYLKPHEKRATKVVVADLES